MLKTYTKLMSLAKPSSRDLITNECVIVINNALLNNNLTNNNYNSKSILTLNELNEFTEFLINNNYIITEHCYNTNNNTNSSKKIIYSFKITI